MRYFFSSAILFTLVCWLSPLNAQPSTTTTNHSPLKIGTKVAPPFVMQNSEQQFEGISVALWKRIADDMGIEYEFVATELDQLLAGVEQHNLDVSVAAITMSAQREAVVDFSHPYFSTGIAIAVSSEPNKLVSTIKRLFSWEFFVVLSGLCLLLLVVGLLLWVFERKRNADMFGGSAAEGIGASFWWAAVTMTTVGYGDKAPITLGGRVIGFIWMFAAIILISSFTAAIATSLTVNQLATDVKGLRDLYRVNVATIAGSSSAAFLTKQGIAFTEVTQVQAGLTKLKSGEYDAFVYDKPIMQYVINQHFGDSIQVLPEVIERQDYAIALPEGSVLREEINLSILRIIESDEWADVMAQYLGN